MAKVGEPGADRKRGITLMLLGVFWISPDSVLCRLAENDMSAASIPGIKYAFVFFALLVVTPALLGGLGETWRHMQQSGYYMLAAVVFETGIGLTLTLSFVETSAANALVLFSLSPLWGAIGARLLLSEPLPRRTIVAIVVGVCCAVAVFVGSTLDDDDDDSDTSTGGDVLGLCAGIFWACYVLTCRACDARRPGTKLLPALTLACIPVCLISLALVEADLAVTSARGVYYLALNGAVVVSGGMVCYTLGPKYITPAEGCLISLLETPLGTLWVYIITGSDPNTATLVAGAVLIATIAGHEMSARDSLRKERRDTTLHAASKRAEDGGAVAAGEDGGDQAAAGESGFNMVTQISVV